MKDAEKELEVMRPLALAYLEKQNHDGKKWITPAELNRLLTLRYEAGFDDGVRNEMKKQKEQKPAEWSEDDKSHLASIIGCIELCNTDMEDAASVLGYYDGDIKWLKSLRPSWKPSEEQMEELERCVEYLEESDEDADILAGLYNDLKKLM